MGSVNDHLAGLVPDGGSLNDRLAALPAGLAETYAPMHVVAAPSGDATGATDLTAIQAKIDAAATAGGGIVALLPGTYIVGSHVKMKTGVHLVGAGMRQTTIQLVTDGNSVIQNNSWNAAPTSWATQESGYSVSDLTCDANKAAVVGFRYGIAFQAVSKVSLERVRVINTETGSGIFINNGYDLAVRDCEVRDCDGNGIFVSDVIRYDVSRNTVKDIGDFGIEIGSGYDYGTANGTAYCGDGVVIGNLVADCANFAIGVRGFIDATANPNNHKVLNVVVTGNTVRDSANLNEIAYYELVENITVFGNNKVHGGVQVLETARLADDLAGADFTSGGAGVVLDVTGLSVSHPLGKGKQRCEIKLRARANSSVSNTNAMYVTIDPAPLVGKATASAVMAGTGGADQQFVVVNDVILAANTAYTIKAQFYQGGAGTFTVQGSDQNTELIAVTTPIT